ncbi:small conductance mechanosensitive channel [Carnobacterium iners]|uniref:Small conductance mechanosensitive channel n=1 Tax=Carnobacterium iners TaxID=1073423 RepID=A0A1X7NRQ5_9LACT|nr:mechanosensitive ion channel domain-containing protein [Carnobacterium iners]SEK88549.1 small conductance mechanosensitive channel [Carnobacterium iners]SMH40778.1 small conductance mechanosensitive channel [Carnobacterium iners]
MNNQSDSSVTTEVVNTVAKQTSFFIEFWQNIDWRSLLSSGISKAIQIFFFFFVYFIFKKIGNVFITRTFTNYRGKKNISPSRLGTLDNLTHNIYNAVIGFFLAYAILSEIGIPVGTLLAGAGVIGLAFSLGAQGFVSDIVNGFFILLEKQVDIGDVVTFSDVTGTVVDVNLKTTTVKSFDGTLNFVPNRYITIVSNLSREDMRAQIDIRLEPNVDMVKVNTIIEQVNKRLVPLHPEITQEPVSLGLMDIGDGFLAIRIHIFALSGSQYAIQNIFFQEYVTALTKEEIIIPVTPIKITT